MVHSSHPIPDVVVCKGGEVQLGPRRNVDRPAAVLRNALEVSEEMELIFDNWPTDVAAKLNLPRVGFIEVLLRRKIVPLRHFLVLKKVEGRTVKLVSTLLGHSIHN